MRRVTLLCTLFVLLALPLTALAQRTTGDIRGVVTDESGAVLPGVTVTLRGPGVPGAPTTVTNESGIYRFPNLPPGAYQISAELQGFATKTQTGIPVALGATVDVDVQAPTMIPSVALSIRCFRSHRQSCLGRSQRAAQCCLEPRSWSQQSMRRSLIGLEQQIKILFWSISLGRIPPLCCTSTCLESTVVLHVPHMP